MQVYLFYAFALLTISSAILVVSIKSIARSLFLFFITLFGMAGLYLFAFADFVAITQIMVYVGGVLILMLFAFMLSNKTMLDDLQRSKQKIFSLHQAIVIPLIILFFGILLIGGIQLGQHVPSWITRSYENSTMINSTDNNIEELGKRFMTFYLLPFEVISIFLMMALIGASHFSRKEQIK